MDKTVTKFSIKLLLILSIVFCVHLFILKQLSLELFDNKIILSYGINFVLAISIFGIIFMLRNKYKTQLGFLFLIGSALKFAVFFIVFYPIFKADGLMSKPEFASFFVPYGLCLIIETYSLAKWLNKTE